MDPQAASALGSVTLEGSPSRLGVRLGGWQLSNSHRFVGLGFTFRNIGLSENRVLPKFYSLLSCSLSKWQVHGYTMIIYTVIQG